VAERTIEVLADRLDHGVRYFPHRWEFANVRAD
jgi:hypothetical protein